MVWGDVETLTIYDDKSVHGCEAKSVMISVHGSERLYDEVWMKEWMMNNEGCDEEMWMKSAMWCGILGDARVVWEMWWRVVKRVWYHTQSVMISVKRREEWELKWGDERVGEWGGGGEAAERSDITPN